MMPTSTVAKGVARRRKAPKPTDSYILAPVVCDDRVVRIRISREVFHQGSYRGEQFTIERNYYLDGTFERNTFVGDVPQQRDRGIVAPAAVPLRTKDVTDFGRLQTAVSTLVAQMGEYDSESPKASEQMESFIRSYQGILEWQRQARARLAEAEGQIDVAGTVLRQVMGL